jgi:hypothetical protein
MVSFSLKSFFSFSIINFNNSFFRRAAITLQQKLNETLTDILPVYPALEPLTKKIEHAYANIYQHVSPKAGSGRVEFRFIEADENEDGWKAESLERLPSILEDLQQRGYQPGDIAILVRKNQEEQDVIHKLLTYKNSAEAKSGVCYDILGNEGLLVGAAASVRFILGIMQLFVNPEDSIQQTIVTTSMPEDEKACPKTKHSISVFRPTSPTLRAILICLAPKKTND